MKIRILLAACAMGFAILGAASAANAADVRMFVRHEVADYATWRKSYNAFASVQKKNGVIHQAVYQSADDPNDVTVIHDFHTLDAAKAFAALPELKAAMEKSGIKGAPQIWFTTRSIK
jgi:ABC-type sugar transport system substrate-binding protein